MIGKIAVNSLLSLIYKSWFCATYSRGWKQIGHYRNDALGPVLEFFADKSEEARCRV